MGIGTGAGTGSEQVRGWRPVDGHRVGTGTETRTVEEMGTGMMMGTGTRIGSGRAEERRRSARNRTRVGCRRHVRQGRNLGGKRKKCRKERVGPVAANPHNLENNKEAGGTRYPGLK